jgi:hypothetical protein
MEDKTPVFEEELVDCSAGSALRYFSAKGYGLRPKLRACVSLKAEVGLNMDEKIQDEGRDLKEKYKELSRAFHGSKAAKSVRERPHKKAKISFSIGLDDKLSLQKIPAPSSKPQTRLFGFT